MLWFKRFVFFILLVFFVLLAIAVIEANQTPVSFDLLIGQFSTTTGKALVATLALSLILLVIATAPIVASYKFRIKRLQKRLQNQQTQVIAEESQV